MSTNQLTILWYGTLAAVWTLLATGGGEPWPSLAAIGLITGLLIYTFSSWHSAQLQRVFLFVAAPFVLAAAAALGVYGYQEWSERQREERIERASSRITFDSLWVTEATECEEQDPIFEEVGLTEWCSALRGRVTNGSDTPVLHVSLRVSVEDMAGNSKNVEKDSLLVISLKPGASRRFSAPLRSLSLLPAQSVDSVRVTEVVFGEGIL